MSNCAMQVCMSHSPYAHVHTQCVCTLFCWHTCCVLCNVITRHVGVYKLKQQMWKKNILFDVLLPSVEIIIVVPFLRVVIIKYMYFFIKITILNWWNKKQYNHSKIFRIQLNSHWRCGGLNLQRCNFSRVGISFIFEGIIPYPENGWSQSVGWATERQKLSTVD